MNRSGLISAEDSIWQGLLRLLGRHFVCLGIAYIALDNDRKRVGPERFFSVSGFVMSLRGEWFFVTAGHIIKEELDDRVNAGEIEVTRSVLADSFGSLATHQAPVPFDYANARRAGIDNRELGLDVGLVHLRE